MTHVVQRHVEGPSEYVVPGTIDEALSLLAQHGRRCRPIAGGTDLLLELARGARIGVDVLVDIGRIPGLDRIEVADDTARLGAMVTHNMVIASSELVTRALPLAQACREVGAPALRNRATVVGNVVTASPANDTLSALFALGASVLVRSVGGSRRVPVAEFCTGFRQVDLADDELVTELEVPLLGPDQRGIFVKLGLRRAQAISVVHVAAVVTFDGEVVVDAVVALGSVAPQVLLVPMAGEVLRGRRLDDASIAAAAQAASEAAAPIDDLRASAAYRLATVGVMVRRGLAAVRDGGERDAWSAPPRLDSKPPTASVRASVPATASSLCSGDEISLRVNGRPMSGPVGAGQTLLEWLRDEARTAEGLSLSGTKEGCAEGECGACTVHLDGAAVLSCLVPAAAAASAGVTTVEGLVVGSDVLHPIQQAFVDCTAVQCGYCIPGFLMAAAKLIEEVPSPTRAEVEQALAGNLCRCTGYYRITEAVTVAARSLAEERR